MLKMRDGVLDAAGALGDLHRVADRLDAHAVDGQVPRVGRGLDVGDRQLGVTGIHAAIIKPRRRIPESLTVG
jgi:hypothetical protein